MPKYFDIHSHLGDSAYDSDREEVIARLKEADTNTIVIGTDFESSRRAVDLADKYEEIYACIGIHPIDNPNQIFEREKFEVLVKHPKTVAIGECGMDFFHADKDTDFERQKKLFLNQIEFALSHNKPIMIHSRSAYGELLEILEPIKKEYKARLRGNIHFFAGDLDTARRFFEIGFTISFTGVITFTHDYDEVIRFAPLDMIMSETDSPYVTPTPYRGRRNESSYVVEVVRRIAEIRGEDMGAVGAALVNNAFSMIG